MKLCRFGSHHLHAASAITQYRRKQIIKDVNPGLLPTLRPPVPQLFGPEVISRLQETDTVAASVRRLRAPTDRRPNEQRRPNDRPARNNKNYNGNNNRNWGNQYGNNSGYRNSGFRSNNNNNRSTSNNNLSNNRPQPQRTAGQNA